jgi:uncharacterized protein
VTPLLGIALLAACVALAATEPPVPPLTGRVVDRAGLLGNTARLEQAIQELAQRTGGQLAVLTIPSLRGDTLEGFSLRVAESWKIGKAGQDNGAILLLVRDSRDIRLEVGRGWEGPINDARAGDIIRGMRPYCRAGQFGDSVLYAVGQVTGFVTGQPAAAPPNLRNQSATSNGHPRGRSQAPSPLFTLLFIIVFITISILSAKNGRTYRGRGGYYGGGFGGGGFGGGGFSGGGGSFSGGGASGRW